MIEVNVKQLRNHLARFITEVSLGKKVAVKRNGKMMAQLIPPPPSIPPRLPDLTEFRASIQLRGEGLSETVIKERLSSPCQNSRR